VASAERASASGPGAAAGPPPEKPPSRSEQRNAEVRAGLEPLRPGERPAPVTVAAVLALVLAVANVVASAATGDLAGEGNRLAFTVVSGVVLLGCAIGMWRRHYLAVLAFEIVLGLQLSFLGLALLVGAFEGWQLPGALLVFAALATLFWKLIRPMARLQMPEGRPGDAVQ
jgi:hypothetical protein